MTLHATLIDRLVEDAPSWVSQTAILSVASFTFARLTSHVPFGC